MQTKYLQSFGRTKSRKLRDNSVRLMADVLPGIQISEFPEFAFKPKEIWLEIGFGDGGHLLHQAVNNPQVGFIGFEPFINGTVKLLRGVEDNKLNNIRVATADFRVIVEKFPENSIDRVFILFPDPWPKKKQKKRRLVAKEALDILARVMKPGAKLRVATDHEDYAEWIAEELVKHPKFKWLPENRESWHVQPADHIETKYQKKNLAKSLRPMFFEVTCDKKLD